MKARKVFGIMALALLLAVMSAPQAQAGVGGCYRLAGCGGPQAAQAPALRARGTSDVMFDTLKWIFPSDVVSYMRGVSKQGFKQLEGVGGCFFGVGGCKL